MIPRCFLREATPPPRALRCARASPERRSEGRNPRASSERFDGCVGVFPSRSLEIFIPGWITAGPAHPRLVCMVDTRCLSFWANHSHLPGRSVVQAGLDVRQSETSESPEVRLRCLISAPPALLVTFQLRSLRFCWVRCLDWAQSRDQV